MVVLKIHHVSSHHYIKSNKNYKGVIPVGKPIKGVKVKIARFKASSSKFGQILISGSSLMNGYHNLKKLNKKKIIKRVVSDRRYWIFR